VHRVRYSLTWRELVGSDLLIVHGHDVL